MSRKDQPRKQSRKSVTIERKPLILVVCEGKVTETQYFEGLHKLAHEVLVEIDVKGGEGVPLTLVHRAKKYKEEREQMAKAEKDENLEFDQVWCVFDVDEHPNIPEARVMARDNGIYLAISNPSVELWLFLHFTDAPGCRDRYAIRKLLEKHIVNYDKHIDINQLLPGYAQAVKSAERIAQRNDDVVEWQRNPSSGIFRLTRVIVGNSPQFQE